MFNQYFLIGIRRCLKGITISLISFSIWFFLPMYPAQAASTWVQCVPIEVMNYHSRIHIKCASAIGGITYFAASTSDKAFVNRTLSILSTAQVAGRTLNILYDPANRSGASIGCQVNDCRLIQAAGFGK